MDYHNGFIDVFNKSDWLLTEGAIVERLKHEYGLIMDRDINHAGFIYNEPEKSIIKDVYKQYIELAIQYQLPIMLMTPTRRVNYESVARSEFKGKNVIQDSISFLTELKKEYTLYNHNILIGGLVGCKGDAYDAKTALGTQEAHAFHKNQIEQFAHEEINFLFAGIMPALSEALGMAYAMASTTLPYIISFMLGQNGKLLDGNTLAEAIKVIDQSVSRKPVCYMANCIHPYNLKLALSHNFNMNSIYLKRMQGIQSNASLLEPWALNNSTILDKGDYGFMIKEMQNLKENFGFKILGGCCGTDACFIGQLANSVTKNA